MALILIEPYSRYAAHADCGTDNDDLTTQWAIDGGGHTINTTGGRFGARVLEVQQSAREHRIRLGSVSGTTLIVGAAIRWDSSGSTTPAANSILRCSTAASAYHWQISLGMCGNLYIFSSGGSTLVGTVANAIQTDVWHYLEVKVVQDNSGSMTIKIDGVQVFTISATDFQNGSAAFESLWIGGNSDNFNWEDVIIMDGSGSTFNDFMGDMRFEVQLPDADGSTIDWTASAGNRYQCIDDSVGGYNDDTDYISSGTTDQVNLSSHATVSATNATTIHFAALFALSRSDTTGDKIALVVKSSATTDTGADLAVPGTTSTAYRWRKKIWEQDPNTAAAWTVSNINSAEFGVKKRV